MSQRLVPLVEKIAAVAARQKLDVYVVGGLVRDGLIGRPMADNDLDLVVDGDGHRFADAVARALGGAVRLHERFLTAKLTDPSAFAPLTELDVASARCESYPRPGALPVVERAPFEDDLKRRDFSCNAIALSLHSFPAFVAADISSRPSLIVDPLGGYRDLVKRELRTLHPRSFYDDPTRIVRGCRYAARLDATWEPDTAGALRDALADGVWKTISVERLAREIQLLAEEGAPHRALAEAKRCGALATWGVVAPGSEASMVAAAERLATVPGLAPGCWRLMIWVLFWASWPESEREGWAVQWRVAQRKHRRWQRATREHPAVVLNGKISGSDDEWRRFVASISGD